MLHQELAANRPPGPTAITLGVFDGVHLGHQHLFRRLQAVAGQHQATPLVITFANHPLTVLRPDVPLLMLTTLEERIRLVQATGIEYVAPISFTRDLSLLTAEEFVLVLRHELQMAHLVVGPDFAIGYQRKGTIPVLEALGQLYRFSVEAVQPLSVEGAPVNSTAVRAALAAGDVEKAARSLGRPHALTGTVVSGEGRGAELGFPTANVVVPPGMVVPDDGVYVTWLSVGQECYAAATSIGTKPTFHANGPRLIEAHALDFEGNLYGQQVKLEFLHRVRGQERFADANSLVAQMHKDVALVRELLGTAPATPNR